VTQHVGKMAVWKPVTEAGGKLFAEKIGCWCRRLDLIDQSPAASLYTWLAWVRDTPKVRPEEEAAWAGGQDEYKRNVGIGGICYLCKWCRQP
jgi:hypothetical protein